MGKKLKHVIIVITLLAAVVRAVDFPNVPPELNRDEAALGYNAYSILKAGRDEWGMRYPVIFKSFGDYKLPGYIYMLVPFIATFGLNVWAVRLPSFLAGVALVPLVYLFVKRLTENRKWGVLSALVVAVSPWAIHYSRVGFEANAALALFIAGLTVLLGKKKSLRQSILAYGLIYVSLLTYNAPLLLLPFILALLYAAKRITLKEVCITLGIGIIVFLMVLPATAGKSKISVFSDPLEASVRRDLRVEHASSPLWRVYTNPIVYYPLLMGSKYVQTFLPRFLVTTGGANPWHQVPSGAHMLWTEYALFIVGLVLLSASLKKRHAWVTLGFLVLSPIPAMITSDAPHATRSLLALLIICVVGGYGLFRLKERKTVFLIVLLVLAVEGVMYLRAYHVRFLTLPQPEWNAGIGKAIKLAEEKRTEDGTVTYVGNVDFDYVYPLFYTVYDPTQFIRGETVSAFGHNRFVQTRGGVTLPTVEVYREKRDGKDVFVVE